MVEQFEHAGHNVTVETFKIGKGFRWQYDIDGVVQGECKDRPLPNEAVVLHEGMGEARRHAERMPPPSAG